LTKDIYSKEKGKKLDEEFWENRKKNGINRANSNNGIENEFNSLEL